MSANSPAPHKQRPGCLVIGGMVLLGAIILLLVVGAVGSMYESMTRAQALARVSAPGQLVDVGGHKLHILCTGDNQPGQATVILEAGAGGWSIHWFDVQAQVAQFARVCTYDRAGFGWSEAGPLPRDGLRIAAELDALLKNAGENGPYILVGASRGGQYIRLYRDLHPNDVVGMVLVDAEPEDFRTRSAYGRNAATQNLPIFSGLGLLSRIGVLRLLGGDPASAPGLPCLPAFVKRLPAPEHEAYLAVEGQPRCYEAFLNEEAATEQRERQVRETQPPGDLKLVVLTHGINITAAAGAPPEQAAETERIWQALQQELAAQSTRGTLVQAANSGHAIANEQPALVVEAIRTILK